MGYQNLKTFFSLSTTALNEMPPPHPVLLCNFQRNENGGSEWSELTNNF
ncbi:MAG: hypothetical protein IT497_01305 [Ottowia sp.]|nr:hypothetical protein [Ottowia sp.]